MPADKDHLNLRVEHIEASAFARRSGGGSAPNIPNRNRREHAANLRQQINSLKEDIGENVLCAIKFKGAPNFDLLFDDLDKSSFKMELLSIKTNNDGSTSANVRINSTKTFSKLSEALEKYVNPQPRHVGGECRVSENPLPYIASIEQIERASVSDFFTDDVDLLPDDDRLHWWEIWLTNDAENACDRFIKIANTQDLTINERPYVFEDRIIFLCQTTRQNLEHFISQCSLIAEIRLAKTLQKPLAHQTPDTQHKALEELLGKTRYEDTADARIVVLDGNYIVRHPLITTAFIRNQQADSTFNLHNTDEHATEMAGLALFGNLQSALTLPSILINYRIEGVQIHDGNVEPNQYGAATENAINITSDNANSAYIMPVTEEYDKHKGEPSSWSSYIDKIIFERKKLFAISVGNLPKTILDDDIKITERVTHSKYKAYQKNGCIESPAQAWNVLSVGAFTNISDANLVAESGRTPFAPQGDISPLSRTSCQFESKWPIKPDVLFEGGNMAVDIHSDVVPDDALSLTTCNPDFTNSPFTTINATSAATGMAGQFIGALIAKYPNYWPETIRALIVHSAEWTDTMKDTLPHHAGKTEQTELLRMFGYGVPDLERAKYSASNALTLVAQKDFQVFGQKLKNGLPTSQKTSQVVLIPLPWPEDILQGELSDKNIKIKITLSYFIKSRPSKRGYKNKYAYQSHSLRFDLQRPTETKEQFERRINKLIETEENEERVTSSDTLNWLYGVNARSVGSIHKDVLEVTGAQLAAMKHLAVYSVSGWWKSNKKIQPNDTMSRFSLIVDIDAGEVDIDLYNRIATEIEILTPNEIVVGR